MPITVRKAHIHDAGPLLRLHREVLAEGDWFITTSAEFAGSIDRRVRHLRELQRAPGSCCIVAELDGDVVGFLTIQGGHIRRMVHAGKLEIMVAAAARGHGAGRALMARAMGWAEANPVLTKVGLSVFDTNERAIALYTAFGFVEEGRRPREYRMEDGSYRGDVLMYRFV